MTDLSNYSERSLADYHRESLVTEWQWQRDKIMAAYRHTPAIGKAANAIPHEIHEAFVKLFLGFGRALAAVQIGYRGGNWQLVGCRSLLTLARLFPEFKESGAWERRAIRYLDEHIDKDFYADGGHRERRWGYGYMSLEGLADAHRLARRHGGLGDRDDPFLKRIRQAYRWFAKTLGPNELKPAYGDCALGLGSNILDAARKFFPAGTPRRLGVDAGASCLLKPSQFAIMRNGNDPDSACLLAFARAPALRRVESGPEPTSRGNDRGNRSVTVHGGWGMVSIRSALLMITPVNGYTEDERS